MKTDIAEIIGNALLIAAGVFIVFIFWVIEVKGMYAYEANVVIRRFELASGVFMVLFGIWHLIRDVKRM